MKKIKRIIRMIKRIHIYDEQKLNGKPNGGYLAQRLTACFSSWDFKQAHPLYLFTHDLSFGDAMFQYRVNRDKMHKKIVGKPQSRKEKLRDIAFIRKQLTSAFKSGYFFFDYQYNATMRFLNIYEKLVKNYYFLFPFFRKR
ncbi:MAG: hypothetical protein J6V13_03885 [Paludibacteraceae bacterium]|nr:hypothetical protein [Paludibacteraceae bacterium]